MRRLFLIVLSFMALAPLSAQEFHCAVQVNYQKLMTTTQQYSSGDKKVYESMKQAVEDFINSRRWTNLELDQTEKIDCSLSIILNSQTSATDFIGQIQIQLRRPVYNSNYTSGLFNYIESGDFEFSYIESQPLDFDVNTFYGNLSSTIAFYAYIMLGYYFDSFALNGGQPFYEVAQVICQTADGSGANAKGWNSYSGQKARYWFMENHANAAYEKLHQAYYLYHRMGLDMMTKDQPQARQNIIQALQLVQEVHQVRANLLATQQFIDVKIAEIVSIFTPAPPEEQKAVYMIIKDVSPINVSKLTNFNTK